ncbi:MAG: DegT/DnrJ/EryC1/StrS family aminotransferase [Bacilli bacterium]|nr:DegT/DnrJ/EryC1/StrS family aminotransferase [Bacilli bacterium]
MKDNILLGSQLAKFFGKEKGLITYSGTLAIELALANLLSKGNVLVSNRVCYSIINTIIKLGLKPIIVCPRNGLYFENNEIEKIVEKEKIDCILLVHQYGYFNEINSIKEKYPNIKIIEDVAQSWIVQTKEQPIGKYSDIVVTSFGKTKPLSYGIGGGLFYNDDVDIDNIDYCDNDSRLNEKITYAYLYPQCNSIDIKELISIGNDNVLNQQNNSKKYYQFLKKYSFIKNYYVGKNSSYHRYVILIENNDKYKRLVELLKKSKIEYQLLHSVYLEDLPICKSEKKLNIKNNCNNYVFLRTRNIDIDNQINELKEILKRV